MTKTPQEKGSPLDPKGKASAADPKGKQKKAEQERAASASQTPKEFRTQSDAMPLNLDTAQKLNSLILSQCSESDLLLFNLPKYCRGQDPDVLLEYITILTKDFPSFCMIKDSGREVTTSYF